MSTNKDCKNLPVVEWYEWKYENGKLQLAEEKTGEDLFSSLDKKFPDTKKIEI